MATSTGTLKAERGLIDPIPALASIGMQAAEIPLFDGLSDVDRRELLTKSAVKNARRNLVVYHAGEGVRHLYLVLSGSVKLVRHSEEGKELIVTLLSRNEPFGSCHPRTAGAVAQTLEQTTLLQMPQLAVKRAVEKSPEFALALMASLEERLERDELTITRLAFDSVPRRLSRFLLDTSDEDTGELRFPLNQSEIANLIGSSRETVCSILNRFRRNGSVGLERGAVRVTDRAELESVR